MIDFPTFSVVRGVWRSRDGGFIGRTYSAKKVERTLVFVG